MSTDFPAWVRGTHFSNLFFLSLLIRSGLEILSSHPKLYWKDDAHPGSEWMRLGKRRTPSDELWTSSDEAIALSPWLALPGGRNLGLGRHWHFWSVAGWLLTGLIYLVCLFGSGQWTRLIPTSWAIFPQAWDTFVVYAHLSMPPDGNPFNPLQQLTYAGVIFLLAPLMILSGLGMSASLEGRFPWVNRWMGGHQGARSIHFLSMGAFLAFIVVHVATVIAHGFANGMAQIVLGTPGHNQGLAVGIGLAGLAFVVAWHVVATRYSLLAPAQVKGWLELGIAPLRRLLFHRWVSNQDYKQRSTYFRVNGRPPRDETWLKLAADNFSAWQLEVSGLVETPLSLSLLELRELPATTQTTRHVCIQGWTAFAEWRGVALAEIIALARPLPSARYLVFHTYDDKWEHPGHGYFYEVIDLELATRPQTIVAYEMNGEPLPTVHGAPLRLRCEGQLGYKMAKWLRAIEFTADFAQIGEGQGGWRDDVLHYFPSDAGM